jgi:hypothetical protein
MYHLRLISPALAEKVFMKGLAEKEPDWKSSR